MAPITIRAGETVRLGADGEQRLGSLAYLRSTSLRGLKMIAGLQRAGPIRLDDQKLFEPVRDPGKLKAFVSLTPKSNEDLKGIRQPLFRAILAALPTADAIPDTVRLEQRLRTREEWRNSGHLLNELPNALVQTRPVRTVVFQIPDWIVNLHLYFTALILTDLVLEKKATLHLESTLTALQANSITMMAGSRIIQESPYLMVTIVDSLKGVTS